MSNPLLTKTPLPLFSQIRPEQIEPALDHILADNRAQLKKILQQNGPYTWQNLILPLEMIEDQLNSMWAPVRHLHSVADSEELRKVYTACLPKLADYSVEINQNEDLYKAFESIANSSEFQHYTPAQKKVITNALRDFRLAGVHLEPAAKKHFAELNKELSQLTTQFEQNVLDATQGWHRLVSDPDELSGIPEHAIHAAKQAAANKQLMGWLFTLDAPSFMAVITYADSQPLRREMYHAYITRASDEGPNAHKWDNSKVMENILRVKYEMAKLLGFNSIAEDSLATKMAKTPQEVLGFLDELINASQKKAQQEFVELSKFAKDEYQIETLYPWDISYYGEKLRQHNFALSEEDLRPYFPEDQVLSGLFSIVERLYGIRVKEVKNKEVWCDDVRFFEIYDENNVLRGQFYIDLYARANKRGGAWMDDCRIRFRSSTGEVQTPVAFLTCNFNAPIGHDPALFTHEEVLTLFHEFGHGLQHMLTKVDYFSISGINGIPWDAVEVASQFMENWCWEKPGVDLIAKHYKTEKPLPADLFKKMHKAKNFQTAMLMTRQLEFSLFDFRLHHEYDPQQTNQIQGILDEVRAKIAVVPIAPFNRFQHSFSHIFAGSYGAGYYSYKWAEVLACDAFSKFEDHGIFDRQTGQEFLHYILETGGSEDPMDLFIKFRGRAPKIDALLKFHGILE